MRTILPMPRLSVDRVSSGMYFAPGLTGDNLSLKLFELDAKGGNLCEGAMVWSLELFPCFLNIFQASESCRLLFYRHVRLACRIHYELWLNNTQQILECSFALWHSIQPCLRLSTCLRDSWQALAWNVSHLWDWPMKFLHIVLSMHFKGAGCNKGKGTQNKSF